MVLWRERVKITAWEGKIGQQKKDLGNGPCHAEQSLEVDPKVEQGGLCP